MESSRLISIFNQPPPTRSGETSLVVSLLVHGVAFVWLYFGLNHLPRIDETAHAHRFSVRVVRQDDIEYPTPRPMVAPSEPSRGHAGAGAASQTTGDEATPAAAEVAAAQPSPEPAAESPAPAAPTPAPVIPASALAAPKFKPTAPGAAPTIAQMHAMPAPPLPTSVSMPAASLAAPPPPDLKQLLAKAKTQTLIQPDVPPEVKLQQEVPLPQIVKWSPDSSHDKLVILPTPKEATAALAKPVLKSPNREIKPADVKIASSVFKSAAPVLPSTTSPVVVRMMKPMIHVPETASKASAASTPVQIVSLSAMQSKQAVIPIPAANSLPSATAANTMAAGHTETAKAANNGSAAAKADAATKGNAGGKADNSSASAKADSASNAAGKSAGGAANSKPDNAGAGQGAGAGQSAAIVQSGAGQNAGAGVAKTAAGTGDRASVGSVAKPAVGAGAKPATSVAAGDKPTGGVERAAGGGAPSVHPDGSAGAGSAIMTGPGIGMDPLALHVTQPKDGRFGVVVVGSSLAEQYPETQSFWSGRLIYTVYLHVGPGKSWILQYSLPRESMPAAAGAATKPDAPWPFDMVRPHLVASDFNSDAIMVHGFVNLTGRFERLEMVFPTEFAKTKLVLNALQQWQFRPARQNGQVAPVEVLLIIPEETE